MQKQRVPYAIVTALAITLMSAINISAEYLDTQKEIVVIIPSYNNANYYQKNLDSVFMQNYENFRAIYIDDCSSDGTGDLVESYIQKHGQQERVFVIKNKVRYGALANIYNAIHACNDNVIIATLDGDDWFAHANVLDRVNKEYTDNNAWLTYGQFELYPRLYENEYTAVAQHVINNNSFRSNKWTTSHLRTFYAWLFKAIKKEDLLIDGKFFPVTWDQGFMFPMLEMSGNHSKYIADVLYIYNIHNPLNDNKVHTQLQNDLERLIRNKPRYTRLTDVPEHVRKKR